MSYRYDIQGVVSQNIKLFIFNNLLIRLVLISVELDAEGEKTMVGNQVSKIFDGAFGFWVGSDIAAFAMIASFALCGAFVVHKLQTPKRRKKFSDWRSVKLIAIIPALISGFFSFSLQDYSAIPVFAFAAFMGAFSCYVVHYTAKNPKEFVRFLLLPVWMSVQLLIIASEILPKKSKA